MIGTSVAFALTLAISPSQARADNGSLNTATGDYALEHVTPNPDANVGIANTADGYGALNADTTGKLNTAVGYVALRSNNADFNTAVGAAALFLNEDGDHNTATGGEALFQNRHGSKNTADGYGALTQNVGGCNNTATGMNALQDNVDGCSNTADGLEALQRNTYASDNTAMGWSALSGITGYQGIDYVGSDNTAIGVLALANISTGQDNTAIGFRAGGTNVGRGDNSLDTYIGDEAGPGVNESVTDSTAIGFNATVSESHALVLGDGSTDVGIGTSTPAYQLDVHGHIRATDLIYGDISGNSAGFTGKLSGDVTGGQSTTRVSSLQGEPLDLSTAPTNGQILLFNGTSWTASSGGGAFILNSTTLQTGANFNIDGNGTIGGTLIAGQAGIGTGGAPNSLLQIGKSSTSYGSYLQLPLVTNSSGPPAADCNSTTFVGRVVLQYSPKGSSSTNQRTLWVCLSNGSWSSS